MSTNGVLEADRFLNISFDWNGDGPMVLEIGTTRRRWTWRSGSVLLCFDTFPNRRRKSMCGSKAVKPNEIGM
jgi:hypothetical protein